MLLNHPRVQEPYLGFSGNRASAFVVWVILRFSVRKQMTFSLETGVDATGSSPCNEVGRAERREG